MNSDCNLKCIFETIDWYAKKNGISNAKVPVRLIVYCRWRTMNDLKWNAKDRKKNVCLELFICNAVGKLEYLFCMFETTIRMDDVSNKNLFHFHFLKKAAVYWRIFARFGQNVLACARFKVKQVTTGDTKYQKSETLFIKLCMLLKYSARYLLLSDMNE